MSKRLLYFIVFLIALMGWPVFVFADLVAQVPKEVGQLQSDMISLSKQYLDIQEQNLEKPEINLEQPEAPPMPQGPSFKVVKIELVGNTIFSTDELSVYVEQYEGKVLSLKDLQDLALLITARYQMDGYMTCRAFIPPQKVFDGKVIIRILEGRVGAITITGNRWFSDKIYFDRIQLARGQFFDMQQLAMSLQDMNQLPDRFVKAYLQPGSEAGTSDIVIAAQDQNPLHASYEYNLEGTELSHVSRDILHLTDNNLTGHGDSLQTAFTGTNQHAVIGGMLQYVLPSPKDGLTYSFNGGYNYSRLEKDLRPLKVVSYSYYVSPGVTKSFIKGQGLSVDGYLGFEFKNSKTVVDKNQLSNDRSRVLDIGPRVALDDKFGKTFVAGDARVGIPDILGGTGLHNPDGSRIKSGGEFFYMTSSVDRINRLPFGSYMVLHAGGQYSPMPLSSLEQFYLGGMSTVRGYPESDSSGDSGFNYSAELRVPPYFIPEDWHIINSKDKTWRDTLSLVAFLDGGRTFNYYRQNASSPKDRSLLGVGGGIRYYVTPDMNCQAGVGFPIGDKSSDEKHLEPYLSARVGF